MRGNRRDWPRRLLWFVALYAGGLLAISVVAYGIRLGLGL